MGGLATANEGWKLMHPNERAVDQMPPLWIISMTVSLMSG